MYATGKTVTIIFLEFYFTIETISELINLSSKHQSMPLKRMNSEANIKRGKLTNPENLFPSCEGISGRLQDCGFERDNRDVVTFEVMRVLHVWLR